MVIIFKFAQIIETYHMTKVKFYDPSFEPDRELIYSIISAKYKNRWIFVRHQNRSTWEIAGGHIEIGETPHDTACRELMEETGALRFNLECVATYSVMKDGRTGYGRLYLAEVFELGPVPDVSEIVEVKLFDHLPENLTYPDIQPFFFRKSIEHLMKGSSGLTC
jgi:8-oxo-dGTP diphosphatase